MQNINIFFTIIYKYFFKHPKLQISNHQFHMPLKTIKKFIVTTGI